MPRLPLPAPSRRTSAAAALGLALGPLGCTEPLPPGGTEAGSDSSTSTTTTATGVSATTMSSSPSSGAVDSATGTDSTTEGSSSTTRDDGSGILLDVGGLPDGGSGCDPSGPVTLTGTVFAPNGTTPVSGALVYTSPVIPDPIPDSVYCNECTETVCGANVTFTESDGTFSLPTGEGEQYFIVEKGQFRRITSVDLAAGVMPINADWSTLPSQRDPAAGEYAPNIAMAWGVWDRMENLLAKLGMAAVTPAGAFDQSVPPNFDIYSSSGSAPFAMGTIGSLLADPVALSHYHILFLPCTPHTLEPGALTNLQDWVAAGGRVYMTDLDAFNFQDAFPQYQTFGIIGGFPGFGGTWPGQVEDPDLAAWLMTFGHAMNIDLHDNASSITALPPVMVDDGMGGQVDVGHHTWVSARDEAMVSWTPAAVSGQYGCGRNIYTTYHNTPNAQPAFLPQELTMLYIILEAGVCQENGDVLPPAG